jgi:hypothetical protein
MNFSTRLSKCSNYSDIFVLVKEAVNEVMCKKRIGLSLGLMDLPSYIGAFHQLGSNFIVLNKKLLEKVVRTNKKSIINSYIFHVLLHEYIHCLGYANEQETQSLAFMISEKTFGPNHLVSLIAKHGIGYLFDRIGSKDDLNLPTSKYFEVISNFENDNTNYFS